MLRLTVLSALAGILLVACGDDGSRPDAGPAPMDVGPPPPDRDVGPPTPGEDAGKPPDAGRPMGGSCPAGACDIVAQDCSGAGEGCYWDGSAPICAPAGSAGDGEPCEGANDCREGFLCDGGERICRAVCCDGNHDDCPLGQMCLINLVNEDGTPTGLGFCQGCDGCDILDQSTCPGGQGCYPGTADMCLICVPSTMNLTEGATCSAANDCGPGFLCAGEPAQCHKVCAMAEGAEPSCADGQTCNPVTGFPETAGICIPPGG